MAFAPTGARYLSAPEKWAALRRMHEGFGVPLDVLEPLAACSPEHFRSRVALERWQNGSTSSTLLTRLSAAAEEQLGHFADLGENACEEKRARALSVMAKTLDTITTIEERLAVQGPDANTEGRERDDGIDGGRLAEYERQIAALAEAMS